MLSFVTFDLADDDIMIAFEGEMLETNILGIVEGSGVPGDIQSQGQTVSGMFIAGGEGGAAGFQLTVTFTGL